MSNIITSFIRIKGWDNEKINGLGHFLAYNVEHVTEFKPFENKVEKVYNHCLNATPDPHYYASYRHMLYALSPQATRPIEVNGKKREPTKMTWEQDDMRHVLIKVLYSAMFERKHEKADKYKNPLINNTDVYVQIKTFTWPDDQGVEREWVYTIMGQLNQHHRQPDLFVLGDGLTRFKSVHKNDDLPAAVYTTINFGGQRVMCRVKSKEVSGLLKKGSHTLFIKATGTKSKRTKSVFFDDRNLSECKAYPIHRMSELIVTYLNEWGIEAEVWKPSTTQINVNKQFTTQKWVDFADKPLYLVDGRLRQQHPHLQPEPATFSAQLQQVVSDAVVNLRTKLDWLPQEIITLPFGTQPPNPQTDMVMVLSDNNIKDWQAPDDTTFPKTKAGPLYGLTDATGQPINDIYQAIKQHYPSSQVVIVNDKKATVTPKKKEAKNPDVVEEEEESVTPQTYLNYGLPLEGNEVKKFLLGKLPNCFYRWAVKDMVIHPVGVVNRYPLLGLAEKMKDTVFVLESSRLMYLANGDLHLEDYYLTQGNTEGTNPNFFSLIKEQTGWDFREIMQSVKKKRYERLKNPDGEEITTESEKKNSLKLPKANLMISRDFVLEILKYPQSGGRLMPDMARMVERANNLAETVSIASLRCGNSPEEKHLFSRAGDNFPAVVTAINEFLDKYQDKNSVSPTIFKGEAAKPLRLTLMQLLGYTHEPNLATLINKYIGLKGGAKLGPQRVIPGDKGILFIPGYNMYHVGDKDNVGGKVEKWFRFYEVIPHCRVSVDVDHLIQTEILPMLEVPFVRYNRYTVMPFPFNLIKESKNIILSN